MQVCPSASSHLRLGVSLYVGGRREGRSEALATTGKAGSCSEPEGHPVWTQRVTVAPNHGDQGSERPKSCVPGCKRGEERVLPTDEVNRG